MESYSVKAILSAVDQSFSSTITKAGQQVQQFGNNVGQQMKTAGKAMTAAGVATTVMGFKAIKGFGDFQASLNKAAVVAGGTSKDIDGLAKVANHMGAVLPISAQQAADAMVEMARNGASVGEIKKQFPAIAQAATAAGADLTSTAGVVQQAMNIWGDSLKSPEQAAAILVQTANASNASIEDMQQALATIGPTAKLAGMNMQTSAEAIGLLTNRGFSAAQASDDLNHAITQMLAPSSVAKKKMDELRLSFVDSQGKMKPFPQILQEIADKTDGMGRAQKAAALKAMFGAAGMKAIAPLLDAVKNKTGDAKVSWDAYAKEQDKAAKSTGAATKYLSDQANQMQQNIGSKIEQLGGNWEALRNAAMASKSGVNGAILDMMNKTLEWSTNSDSALAKITRGFIGLSPVIGPALTGIGGFITNVGKITSAAGGAIKVIGNLGRVMKILALAGDMTTAINALKNLAQSSKIAKAAMIALQGAQKLVRLAQIALNAVMMANPWTLIAVAIAAVVAALVLFFTKTKTGQKIWKAFVEWLSNAWDALKEKASQVWEAITNAVKGAADKVKAGWEAVTEWFSGLWERIKQGAMTAWQGFVTQMQPIIDAIKNLWNALGEFFSTLWQAIVTVAQAAWQGLVTFFTPLIEGIKTAWNTLGEFFSTLWQTIVTTAQTIWQGLVTFFTPLVEGIKAAWNVLTEFFSNLWTGIQNVTSTIWEAIKGAIQTAYQTISGIISGISNGIKSAWDTVWNGIKSVVSGVWNAIETLVSAAINAVASVIRAVTAAIKGDWQGAWNQIKNAVQTVWNAIRSVVSSAINGVRSVVSGGMSGVRSVVSGAMNGIRSAFSSGWSSAVGVTQSMISRCVSVVSNAGSWMISAGRNFVMGFVNGISGAIYHAVNAAVNMARSAFNAAKAALGIHSPSRVMRDKVGYFVAAGMAKGMTDETSMIQRASNRLAQAAVVDASRFQQTFGNALSMGNLGQTLGAKVDHQVQVNQQPAYINLNLGGTEFGALVDDISRKQGQKANLSRQFRF